MNTLVTDQDIEDFQCDGVVLIRNLFTQDWLQILEEGIKQNLKYPTHRSTAYVSDENNDGHFFFDACAYRQFESYDRIMTESSMAEVAARVMTSTTATLFYISVFVRGPGTRSRTPWHQDQPSWSASGNQTCSMWTSLDPVPANTALEFVRGSHRWKDRYQRAKFFQYHYEDDEDRSLLAEFPDIESNRAQYDIVSWEMQPGDCLVFHGMTSHGGSGDLPPSLGRRAVSVQWLGDDARFRDTKGRDDPQFSSDLLKSGIRPGDRVSGKMCPLVWSG